MTVPSLLDSDTGKSISKENTDKLAAVPRCSFYSCLKWKCWKKFYAKRQVLTVLLTKSLACLPSMAPHRTPTYSNTGEFILISEEKRGRAVLST
ncbi:hypothetical protein P879_07888 [Paragonimus westermani]|uniref:Uncharacterized protein n=1 Tax=Paragonimus westermani TaxID=34504 RepID=A0A8T0DP12_9TREM|nr:hypothetical protein P879_07888 [Paragonimus westermani]